MKFNLLLKLTGKVFNSMIKEEIDSRKTMKAISKEYKNVMVRAKDIGLKNTLIISYAMAAYFIAMNRCDDFTPEENIKIFHDGIKKNKFTKLSLGSGEAYFSEKKRKLRRERSKKTKERKYENDWVVEIVENDPNIYGIDYLECGVCKLCKDENCPELAKYLCSLDFMLAETMGLKLERTTTLAEGGSKCDFRYTINNK